MRVEWAVTARAIHIHDAGDITVEGIGIDTLGAASLPDTIGLPVLARFAAAAPDWGNARHIRFDLLAPSADPDGTLAPIETLELDLALDEPGPEHPEGWEASAMAPLIVEFVAEAEGSYGLVIEIDGRFQTQVPFRVVLTEGSD